MICGQKIGVNEESFVVDLKNLKVYKGVTPIVNLGYCNQSQYCNQSLMCLDYCVLVCTLMLGDLLDTQL
jgi:hypothetical protein